MLSNLLQALRRRRHSVQRNQNLDAVQKLGFRSKLISAAGQKRRYVLEEASGAVHDNGGLGYRSSAELLEFAEKLSGKQPGP